MKFALTCLTFCLVSSKSSILIEFFFVMCIFHRFINSNFREFSQLTKPKYIDVNRLKSIFACRCCDKKEERIPPTNN